MSKTITGFLSSEDVTPLRYELRAAIQSNTDSINEMKTMMKVSLERSNYIEIIASFHEYTVILANHLTHKQFEFGWDRLP